MSRLPPLERHRLKKTAQRGPVAMPGKRYAREGAASQIAPTQRRSRFFVAAAVLMLLVAFLGFAPTFYLRGFVPGANLFPTPAYVFVHGAVMTAWYLLFLAQTGLVASGRADLHRRLGMGGVALAVAVVLTGVHVLLKLVSRLEASGLDVSQQIEMLQVDRIVIGGFCNLIAFSGVVTAAILLRRNSPAHRRLMFWAFVLTLGAALNTNRMFGAMLASALPTWLPMVQIVSFGSLLAYDLSVARRIHAATLWGAMVCLLVLVLESTISASESGRAFVVALAQRGG